MIETKESSLQLPSSSPDNFTLDHYFETLKAYRSANYSVISFKEYLHKTPAGKVLILRHDVDLDLEVAHRMALIDHKADCRSTWFLRLHSRRYNLLSYDSQRIILDLKKMGHEVALHFEPSFAQSIDLEADSYADRQKNIFENITGEKVIGFSSHEPTRANQPELVATLMNRWKLEYHAYETRFTKDMKYLSDSSSRWREGCFSKWLNKHDRMQVLVHPFWWYKNVPQENY